MITVGGPDDKRVGCPVEGCSVGMTLAPEGVELMKANELKCTEHQVLLVVRDA